MNAAHAIVIDLGRKRLLALMAGKGRARGSIKVYRSLNEEIPADFDASDAELIGKWMAGRMREAGFPRGKAVFALGREHVVLKRISLPSIEPAELPEMTRLAMMRDLPFNADEAIIDFVPVEQGDVNTTVLAVAAPRAVIAHVQAVAAAAGMGIERISLRTMGAAALTRAIDDLRLTIDDGEPPRPRGGFEGHTRIAQTRDEDAAALDNRQSSIVNSACLVIDILGESIEFALVADGSIRFSRAAEVPQPQDQLAMADAVVTEARRTWMSCQALSDQSASNGNGSALSHCLIIGEQRVSEYSAEPVSQMLKLPVKVMESHPLIEPGSAEMDRLWPLAGLLLEGHPQGQAINFANPRQTPDVGARTRQRRLVAAGVAVVAILAAWTIARQQLKLLDQQAVELVAAQAEQAPDDARYWRDLYKLEHLRRWESTNVDWLQHASYLTTIAPPPDRLVLDSWSGDQKFAGVKYDSKTKKWSANQEVTIVVDGEARDRETADGFRAALVQSTIYATATPGADAKGGKRMPFGFTYRLRTKESAPAEQPPAATPANPPNGAPS